MCAGTYRRPGPLRPPPRHGSTCTHMHTRGHAHVVPGHLRGPRVLSARAHTGTRSCTQHACTWALTLCTLTPAVTLAHTPHLTSSSYRVHPPHTSPTPHTGHALIQSRPVCAHTHVHTHASHVQCPRTQTTQRASPAGRARTSPRRQAPHRQSTGAHRPARLLSSDPAQLPLGARPAVPRCQLGLRGLEVIDSLSLAPKKLPELKTFIFSC